MKKIFLIVPILFSLVSCVDEFLDKNPLDKLSEDAVFGSEALAESYVNALYAVLPDPFQEGNISSITDESYFRYGGTATRYIADGSMTPSNIMYMSEGGNAHNSRTTVLNIWNRTYEYIYRMNYFINYSVENPDKLAGEAKNRLLGEVYYLRAWAYYNLIQRYSGVPLITKPNSISDKFEATRANFDDCVDFILEDLKMAEELVPHLAESSKGRINKDIVMALRCRVTLLAASPLFNDPAKPEGCIFRGKYDPQKWQRAYDAAKAIVDRADVDGAYVLDDTYDGYWTDLNSPEVIWGKYFVSSSSAVNKAQLLYSVVYFNGWTSMNPTQALVIDYEMNNGKKIYEEGSGYDPEHPFKNRDPRFYYTCAAPFSTYYNTDADGFHENELLLYLLYDGITREDFDISNKSNPDWKEPVYTSKAKHLWHATNTTGIELNKWYIPTIPITESEIGSIVYPWFRLAEMYLNLAECAWNLGKEEECRTYINKVRQRADVMMPVVTESGESLYDRLVNEKRIEFAFEFMRYFDLRRWKLAEIYENIPWAGMQTMLLQKGSQIDTVYRMARPYDESKNNTVYYWKNTSNYDTYLIAGKPLECVYTYKWLGKEYKVDYGDCIMNQAATNKHFPKVGDIYPNYLMPIPANEIAKSNGTIEQNPGY